MKEYTIPRWIDKDGVTENSPLTTEHLQMANETHNLIETYIATPSLIKSFNVTGIFSLGSGQVLYCYSTNDGTTKWKINTTSGFLSDLDLWPLGGATRHFCLWRITPISTTEPLIGAVVSEDGLVYWGKLTVAKRELGTPPNFSGTLFYMPALVTTTQQNNETP